MRHAIAIHCRPAVLPSGKISSPSVPNFVDSASRRVTLAAVRWVVVFPRREHVMQRLATLAVTAALISPTVASGQDYTFGDWARDQGYEPGDVMPDTVWTRYSGIDSLDGIGGFDWKTTQTRRLLLDWNWVESTESGDFSGLTSLLWLTLAAAGGS